MTVSAVGTPLKRDGFGFGGGGAAPLDLAADPQDVADVGGVRALFAGPGE